MITQSESCARCGHQKVMHRPKGEGHKLRCAAYTCMKGGQRCAYKSKPLKKS